MEAIDSVIHNIKGDFEVILINDGSTEHSTLEVLKALNDPRVTIIHQTNKGLASARNIGVQHCKGEILFFLDSDNTILPCYASRAVEIFNSHSEISVVYGNPLFFGEVDSVKRFSTHSYNFDLLLKGNYIDACAFVRKKDFLEVGGFSVHSDLQGWDDWELWIKLSIAGKKFHYLNFDCFGYRVRSNSMIGKSTHEQKKAMLEYIGSKYGYIFHSKYRQYLRIVENIHKNPFRNFFRIMYYKYILRKPLID